VVEIAQTSHARDREKPRAYAELTTFADVSALLG